MDNESRQVLCNHHDILVPMGPRLPIEVCEEVISAFGYLHDGFDDSEYSSSRTLYACCLVCRDWLPRARSHLYSTAIVRVDKISVFSSSLLVCPANGLFVRHLWLNTSRTRRRKHAVDKNHELSLLPLVLPDRLPNVTHLTFEHVSFSALHPKFFTFLVLFRNVRTLTCDHTSFDTPYLLSRLLSSLPNLYAFEAHSVTFPECWHGDGTPLATAKLRHRLHVPSLVLGCWNDFPSKAYQPFVPSSIESLSVCWSKRDRNANVHLLRDLLPSCRYFLRHLVLDFNSNDLPPLSTYCSLSVTISPTLAN